MSFSKTIVNLIAFCNKFYASGTEQRCKPFLVDGKRVGFLLPQVVDEVQKFPDVFSIKSCGNDHIEAVEFSNGLKSFHTRSEAIATVLTTWRSKDTFFGLRGWRDECMHVWSDFCESPLFKIERSAMSIFGFKQYGAHINGYIMDKERGLCLWIGKRSKAKPMSSGKLDQMAAGGLSDADDILGCARRECQEEASVPDSLLDQLKPVGCVSYFYEDERGLFPETQFIFDLELPETFKPVNSDGEVESFHLMSITEIKEAIVADKFKFNCALVMLEFFIRHSIITPDEERSYSYLTEGMHKHLD